MDKPQALGRFICVKWIAPQEEQTAGGIYLAPKKELRKGDMVKLQRGVVTNWGPEVNLGIKRNDVVLYSEYDAQEFVASTDVGEENVYHLIREDFVKANLTE